ncbi:MAG TPA: PAS domain-containing sensor histidine kinase [Mucilaginibacter sp.]|jgi:PAS domain S-box-containing protein|nr:PAS domain-containing sensor histidine kinase [Mucilaginibacter sp.]
MTGSDLLKTVVENVVDGIIIIDSRGIILLANPSACKLFGCPPDELQGKNVSLLMNKEDALSHDQCIRDYQETGQAKIIGIGREVIAKKKDDSTFPARLAVSEVKYFGETLYAGVIHDLTREKKAELEKQAYTSKLEALVEERTEELKKTVKSLELARDEVSSSLLKEKQLNVLKTQFVTIASHEFRTPLSSIQLSASLIERYYDRLEKEKIFSHLAKIKTGVNYLTTLLNDFLSVERVESGALVVQFRDFDLEAEMELIVLEMSAQTKPGQRISYEHFGASTCVKLDDKLLRHCLYNLLSNSIKYSEENTIIRLTTSIDEKECLIEVQDKGIGIPAEDQINLFKPFFRAGNIGEIQGTGLGLNIVKSYAELMHGTIDFRISGHGSLFSLHFPMHRAACD